MLAKYLRYLTNNNISPAAVQLPQQLLRRLAGEVQPDLRVPVQVGHHHVHPHHPQP